MLKCTLVFKVATATIIALSSSIVGAQSTTIDPSGTWRWKYEVDGKTREDFVSIQLEKGEVTGSFLGQHEKPFEIKQAKWKGNQLSFSADYKLKNQSVSLAFTGKMKQDELDGSVTVTTDDGVQEYPWTPKRSVQFEDVLGQWDIVIDADGNQLKPQILITRSGETMKGKYTVSEQSVVDASKMKIRDNQLEFHVEATIDGRKIIADYSGRPYGNNMKGKIEFDLDGNRGEIEFQAKRLPGKK